MNPAEITRTLKRPIVFAIAFAAILISGFISGRVVGSGLIGGFVTDSPGTSMIFFSPADQFYRMYMMLNSPNMFSRLTGYYALLDNKILKSDFLIDRYLIETDPTVKRTIIWVLSHAGEKKRVLGFFSDAYRSSPITVRREILKAMKKIDRKFYDRFIENVNDEGDIPADGEYFYEEHRG